MNADPVSEAGAPGASTVLVDIYGFQAEIRGSSPQVIEGLAADFTHFRCQRVERPVVVELIEQEPPYDSAPPVRATVYTPRNISYRQGPLTYVDYSGRGLGIHNRREGSYRVYSLDSDLLYEAGYGFLVSQMAEHLDARHLHRIHALGLSVAGHAVLVLLPMSGGKSTLAAELLKYPELQLLSDDAPLVDRHGTVHAFPLRLGLLPGSEGQIPAEALRRVKRLEFGPKYLVNYRYFAHRVCAEAQPGVVFLGSRSLSRSCEIHPASLAAATRAMITNCVVGMGLFHGLEFLLHSSVRELAGKAGVAWSRFRNSFRLLRRSQRYHLVLGRDTEENGRVLIEFLRRTYGLGG